MNRTSNNGFVHSIKVPRIYKTASVIIKKVVEEGASLKDLVYSCGHKNIKGVYALVVEAIKHSKELDKVIKNSKLLKKETRLQPWLARILLTELLFGKKELKGESKPVQTVLSYRTQIEKVLKNQKSCDSNSRNIEAKMSNASVLFTFLMYSAAMLILPLFTFFAVRHLLEKEFHITGFPNTAWSVICAVIVANLIIMAYAWRAYKHEVEEENNVERSTSLFNEQIPAKSRSDIDLKKDD